MRISELAVYVGIAIVIVSCVTATHPDYSEYLKPCPVAEPRARTTDEAVRVASARREALIQCNKDKAKLRELLIH